MCKCFNECMNKHLCSWCTASDKWHPIRNYFQGYIPQCPRGATDCINDPGYIKYYYPEWYSELWGELSPTEAASRYCTDEYCCYDNEDK